MLLKILKLDDENFFKHPVIPKKTEQVLEKLKEKFHKKVINDEEISLQSDEMWRIGMICKKDCYYITTEILKCLERNGYEWKIISSSYKIKCRRKRDNKENSNKYSNLNVLIQIFNVSVSFSFNIFLLKLI